MFAFFFLTQTIVILYIYFFNPIFIVISVMDSKHMLISSWPVGRLYSTKYNLNRLKFPIYALWPPLLLLFSKLIWNEFIVRLVLSLTIVYFAFLAINVLQFHLTHHMAPKACGTEGYNGQQLWANLPGEKKLNWWMACVCRCSMSDAAGSD